MQVWWVKIDDFRHITRYKTSTIASVVNLFGCNFVTLSVHLCLQHVCRDAARRAGLLATDDSYILVTRRIHYNTSL